jgi:peptidoglycan hydrolase-like protein with peptidoglycan-binding domain
MELRGPSAVHELVPLDLAGSEYSEQDNWVVRYTGVADVVELGIAVAKVNYTVAAVGVHVVPIKTPPVFDQLLARELEDIASLASRGKNSRASIRRQAKRLFAVFRGVPILDEALQSVAKLGKDARSNPVPAVVRVAEGFISRDAASSIATAFLHTLDKVSPANSRAAWTLVALFPAITSFAYAANNFTAFSPANPLRAVLPLCVTVAGAGVAMLIVSPAGWILSAAVSSLLRLKVPTEYRQRGRNWAPLKGACLFTMSASLVGALYGAAAAMQWVPNVRTVTAPALNYAAAHTLPGSRANRLFAGLANSTPASASVSAESPADTRRAVQRFLIAHGYLHGQADGNLGALTNAAIARYERHERLSPSTPLPELLAYMRSTVYGASAASGAYKPIAQSSTAHPSGIQVQPEGTSRPVDPTLRNRMVVADKTNSPGGIACKDDGTFFGKNVCLRPDLARSYERELVEYQAAQRRLGGVDTGIRIEQERWLESVVHDCVDEQCLTSTFDKRAAELSTRYRGG